MVTGKYNLIQLGSVYITADGTSSGKPCRAEVEGLDALSSDYTGVTVIALDGTPYNQIQQTAKKGLPLVIKIFQTTDTRLDALKSQIESLISGFSSVLVQITGSTGTFAVNCLPAFPKPLEFTGEFQNSYIKNITLNFVVQSQAYILTVNPGALTLTGQSVTLTVA